LDICWYNTEFVTIDSQEHKCGTPPSCLKRIEANGVLVSLRYLVEEMTPIGSSQPPGFPAQHYASLLAGLIHKSNNIITVLSGHSGLLLLEPNLSEEILQPIRRMARAAEMLSRYLDEAGLVSKATALILEPIVFSDFFEKLTRPSGLKIQTRYDNRVTIRGDRRKLKEIFEQILQNAHEAEATSEIVTAAKDAPAIRLSFRDNGHGIKSEVMPRVFDPFFTTRARRGQFGLGLFRARGELARMGGEISATSDGRTYTEILVRIPAA
jgi:signal transduction histidine kinase